MLRTVKRAITRSGDGLPPNQRKPLLNADSLSTEPSDLKSAKFYTKYRNFLSIKYIWKCRLQNGNHFVQVTTCWGLCSIQCFKVNSQWLGARLQYLHGYGTRDTAISHRTVYFRMWHFWKRRAVLPWEWIQIQYFFFNSISMSVFICQNTWPVT